MPESMGKFSITRLKLRHYRSVAGCDINVGPLTLLVGPNGAGKSNILDSLRLVAQSLNENLDNALRERGGISEVRRRSRGHPTHFGISIEFTSAGLHGTFAFQVGAVSGGDFRVSREECRVWWPESDQLINIGSAQAQIYGEKFYEVREGKVVSSSEPLLPKVSEDRLYLVAVSGIEAFRFVYEGLSSVNVYNLNPDAMRHLQKPEAGDLLRRDGSNIASVIERLRRDYPDAKAKVEEYLSRVVEGVVGVERRGLGSWETIEFRQRVAGDVAPWTFQASSMSDGTLRALGVLAALLGGAPGRPSPVGVEEPEAALHPAAAGLLLDALRDASESRQVLVTTHSPDLLDSSTITPEEILAVRSVEGNTVVGPVDAAGQKALRESLFTPGELLRVDQLAPEKGGSTQLELFK
ncbi:AAA family ATPase [Micromonospora fiedleri]|uniref:AAA family ATPase n=1 Tax=Micromonospora fiedleri TaxID=1157498 RepID=A0ABS1UK85_9ACTN|nr:MULTISPECIES: AAA family ATPase [Micromonospora]MBL6276748.1 AAA family ATPase [Micromonospora fiedleri]WSK43542.1 AAA family ATPase [Micromonospora maris]